GVDSYWDPKDTNEIYVPVDGGEIRVLHVKPEKPKNKRPIIHIPGWGVTKLGFNDLYEALHDDIEFYYLETREKGTSKIKRRKANMTIEQKAKDIAQAIEHLGLAETDYVIFAACWAATILLEGLKAKLIKIPTLAVIDPMHKLWFSRFWIKASPFIPTFLIEIFKIIIGFFVFLGMKEKTQLERNRAFVKNAVIWKWKRAAYKVKDLEMISF
ncbi:MAG: alpha/beta fold hydrolase, partial [Candidatus Heimdallarchaeota archaeon]